MKKVLLSLLVTLLAGPAAAALQKDTVVEVLSPDTVLVLQSDTSIHVHIRGSKSNRNYCFDYDREFDADGLVTTRQKSSGIEFSVPFFSSAGHSQSQHMPKKKSFFSVGGIGFGFVNALGGPASMNVNMAASYEVFADLLTYGRNVGRKAELSLGFGINWKNYRMNGKNRFVINQNDISIMPYPNGADIDFSRIKVFSLTFPFRYTQHFRHHLSCSLAAILNVNTYASLKTHYSLDGEKQHSIYKNIHHTPVTVDFMGQVQFHSIGLYVKYSPCRVLNTDFGPDFSHLSAGITLFY